MSDETKARKVSAYLTSETLEILGADEVAGISLSGRINTVAARFDAVRRAHCPPLSNAEWCAVCDANNGCFAHEHQPGDQTMLWANVADSEGLGAKWRIDEAGLLAKMRAWSVAEALAAIEVVVAFWRRCELPADDALRLAGARIAE